VVLVPEVSERLAPYFVWFDVVPLPRLKDEDGNPVGVLRRHYRGEQILLTEEQAKRLLKLGAVGEQPPPERPPAAARQAREPEDAE
jgi:hypothetical protein